MITIEEAKTLVRTHLSELIEIIPCDHPPDNLYDCNPEEEYVFTYRINNQSPMLGGSNYISVSRKTGRIKHYGSRGE